MIWQQYWLKERERMGNDGLLHPRVLAVRRAAADIVLAEGVTVGGILDGRIAESRIPAEVRQAFHAQYPDVHRSLVAEVQHLRGHEAALRGLANGIRGKLFEEQYVTALNHGGLPAGYHAALAHTANNPAWDIRVQGPHHQAAHLLQLKATTHAEIIERALHAHPNIPVVTTHAMAQHLQALHPALPVIDGGISNHALAAEVAGGLHNAGQAAVFHLPVAGLLAAIGFEAYLYHRGRQSLETSVINTGISVGGLTLLGHMLHGLAMLHPLTAIAAALFGGVALSGARAGVRSLMSAEEDAQRFRARNHANLDFLRSFRPGATPAAKLRGAQRLLAPRPA